MSKVMLKPRKARPFWYGHPWVFSGSVERVRGRVRDGDVVELLDAQGRLVGHGFWNSRSQIQVRVVSGPEEGPPAQPLFRERLLRAVALRQEVLGLPERATVYRLVHAEGDGLPGLVVDVVGSWLVLQLSCLGMMPFLEGLLDDLEELLKPLGMMERVPGGGLEEEGLERREGLLRGRAPAGAVEVLEDGTRYLCDPMRGQKTGFYADQRENRAALAPLAGGGEVLDAFSYVGGFGLRMARAGAASVHLVDSSGPALELARRGAEANGVSERVTAARGNVLRVLDDMSREGRSFDLVVADPPRLVRRARDLRKGLRLYHEIALKALKVVRDGGLLVACSCSQHVARTHLDEVLGSAAKEAGVRLQEIHRGGQGSDHPVLLPLEESRYLKVSGLRVWR